MTATVCSKCKRPVQWRMINRKSVPLDASERVYLHIVNPDGDGGDDAQTQRYWLQDKAGQDGERYALVDHRDVCRGGRNG